MKTDFRSHKPVQAGNELGELVHTSKLLVQQESLLAPGTGLSLKHDKVNVFGEEEAFLHLSRVKRRFGELGRDGPFVVRMEPLARLTELSYLSDGDLTEYVENNAAGSATLALCREAVLHAALPFKWVIHIYPDPVLAIANTPNGMERFKEMYGGSTIFLPYADAGLALAKSCANALSGGQTEAAGFVLMQHGVVGCGATVQDAYEQALELTTRAEECFADLELDGSSAWSKAPEGTLRHKLSGLRKAVSDQCGCPVILQTRSDQAWVSFANRDDLDSVGNRGPVPVDAVGVGWRLTEPGDLTSDSVTDDENGGGSAGPPSGELVAVPGAVLDSELGLSAFGKTTAEAQTVGDVYAHAREIILMAEALDAYQPLPASKSLDPQDVSVTDPQTEGGLQRGDFTGEVALVTGAASGIGKACVEAFLARGAAVVGLDINADVTEMIDREDFLGLECDVTDEEAVAEALEKTAKSYGGLDMLVPNAGMFPPGRRIDALSREEWDQVMEVNLDANLALMREAYQLLKASPKGGRVVVMGSRNVPAPGPGAVAYSVSKAGLVQMARVAALEWGGDGIRVNIINPHAVFDTGIWTDEVLQARADHYGLTVKEYKTRNVLGVEVTSRDVGELVAEMCGPLFGKTTGAQIPIDGGSERVV